MTHAKLGCIEARLRASHHFLRRFGRPLEPDLPFGDQDDETIAVSLDVELRPHRDDPSAIHAYNEGSHGIFCDLEVSIPANQVDAALVRPDSHLNAASGIERDVRAVLERYGAYLSDLCAITGALVDNVPGGQADCRKSHQGHGHGGGSPYSMRQSARSDRRNPMHLERRVFMFIQPLSDRGSLGLLRKRTPYPSPPVWYRTWRTIRGQ